jgi:hypothetical protein
VLWRGGREKHGLGKERRTRDSWEIPSPWMTRIWGGSILKPYKGEGKVGGAAGKRKKQGFVGDFISFDDADPLALGPNCFSRIISTLTTATVLSRPSYPFNANVSNVTFLKCPFSMLPP